MRIDVKKFLFVGLEDDKGLFFSKAQEAGITHFISQNGPTPKEMPTCIAQMTQALKILRGLTPLPQEEPADSNVAHGMALRIIKLKEKIEKNQQDLRVNDLEMARVAAFGDFSFENLHEIEKTSNRVIQFFYAKQGFAEENEIPDEVIYVGSDFGLDYFVSITKEPKKYDGMTEMHFTQTHGTLKQKKKTIENEIHATEHELRGYAKYNRYLQKALIEDLNLYHLNEAKAGVKNELGNGIFAIEGWVPVNKIDEMKNSVQNLHVYAEEVAINPEDSIPTYLENTGYNRVGEDLVHIYDTPSHTDKDPSLWVLLWFAFFFSMIVGDAGYGLIFLLTALYIRYRNKTFTTFGHRMWKLFMLLAAGCITWGILMNSFFGIQIGMDNPIRKVSLMNYLVEKKAEYHFRYHDEVEKKWVQEIPKLKDAKNYKEFLSGATKEEKGEVVNAMYNQFSDKILMELALLVGTIHIIVSLLRYVKRNWAAVGWVVFLIGGYLYAPYYLGATSIVDVLFDIRPEITGKEGIYLIYLGIGLAFLLSFIQNKIFGLLEVMNLIQIFGDILSYLRLYALALAGAMVAAVINEFSAKTNIVFGILLFVIGHLVNIALAVMGGVIHGLRLNFLEWYHYSFEGGGKKFDPLRLEQLE